MLPAVSLFSVRHSVIDNACIVLYNKNGGIKIYYCAGYSVQGGKMKTFIAYLLVGIVTVMIGIIVIAAGEKKKKRCTASAQAVIVEVEKEIKESENNGRDYSYTPIYEFTAGGTTVRKSGGIYSYNKKEFRVGDVTTVMYNPDSPEEFCVKGKNGGKAFGIALMLLGFIIIAISFTQI